MNPFNTALLKAPKRSRFDFSHTNTVGLRFGALTPTLSHFIIPGDEVSMSVEQICRLAPMPVPTFVPLKLRHDFFFVPLRLLYGPEYMDKLFGTDSLGDFNRCHATSLLALSNTFSSTFLEVEDGSVRATLNSEGYPFVPGSLFDYLGYPVWSDRNGGLTSSMLEALADADINEFNSCIADIPLAGNTTFGGSVNSQPVCLEKIFAYHFIWRDWYRFTGIQDGSIYENYLLNGVLSVFGDTDEARGSVNFNVTPLRYYLAKNATYRTGYLSQLKYAHLSKDMFTSVRYGDKPTVLIPTGSNGTIPALREASAIQRFIDIISITGQRYFDKVKGLFGVEPEGPKDDRVQFLGRYQQYIKVGEVITTATTSEGNTGDYAGRGILIDGKYLFKRRFTEHGYLFCISSVIPDVAYNGLSRELTDISPLDTPIPSMAEVGDQSVLRGEMDYVFDISGRQNLSLGDQFRYYAYKSAPNECHGFFLTDIARPWSPLFKDTLNNIISGTHVTPNSWNFIFNDTNNEYLYGDRFFLNLSFTEYISRALPKYINYHL